MARSYQSGAYPCSLKEAVGHLAYTKHSSLLPKPGVCIIKYITAVIYIFRNTLECLSLKNRLGWKGLPGTNTLAYFGFHKLQRSMIQAPGE